MRGKAELSEDEAIAKRITPAGAGKSESGVGIKEREEDHLRGCGEKALRASTPRA